MLSIFFLVYWMNPRSKEHDILQNHRLYEYLSLYWKDIWNITAIPRYTTFKVKWNDPVFPPIIFVTTAKPDRHF